ncbi:MAG TPA: hypothetical protein VM576_00935 [Xanthomonadaceae bacterium]|jgi:hypothetical protein|nr:hypothetical protein [Xanthomonadaceae bacterium]
MGKRDEGTQPAADPRRGRNPGYAEDQPDDRRDARQPTHPPPQPNPDEPGMRRDPDPPADPAGKH